MLCPAIIYIYIFKNILTSAVFLTLPWACSVENSCGHEQVVMVLDTIKTWIIHESISFLLLLLVQSLCGEGNIFLCACHMMAAATSAETGDRSSSVSVPLRNRKSVTCSSVIWSKCHVFIISSVIERQCLEGAVLPIGLKCRLSGHLVRELLEFRFCSQSWSWSSCRFFACHVWDALIKRCDWSVSTREVLGSVFSTFVT